MLKTIVSIRVRLLQPHFIEGHPNVHFSQEFLGILRKELILKQVHLIKKRFRQDGGKLPTYPVPCRSFCRQRLITHPQDEHTSLSRCSKGFLYYSGSLRPSINL